MDYKIIKLNYPERWDNIGGDFREMLPNEDGVMDKYRFYINDDDIKECDYWFICEDHNKYLPEYIKCPKENCILITNEAESMWNYDEKYLKQFGRIMTSRADIKGDNVIQQQHIFPWHIKKNYNYLKSCEIPEKKFNLSAVISNFIQLEGHRKRYKLLNRLKGHFKDDLHWFGKGEHPVEDKWYGLAPYKYSIAIENSAHQRYFTEKIIDAYLSFTMPIYWGCPNITDYFPEESLIILEDIDDYKKCIFQVEDAINTEKFKNNFYAILEARNLILDKYQPFSFLANWASTQEQSQLSKKQSNIIYEKSFFSRNKTLKQKLYFMYKSLFPTK